MTDSTDQLLQAIITALGDGTISSLVGDRVYNDVPQSPVFPYIVVMVSSQHYDDKTSTSIEHLAQFNFYSREKSMATEAVPIRRPLYNLFHRKETTLASV